MESEQVVGDVIDSVPQYVAVIKYQSGVEMKLGNELTPTQVKDIPSTISWPTEAGQLYTLVFVDPDAPSRKEPTYREILHWLVVNISGNDLSSGETLCSYIGSGPPKDTGLHRYVMLVYKQTGRFTPNKTYKAREDRFKFQVRSFAKEHNLGQPIAGNFYQAQYDDYVLVMQENRKKIEAEAAAAKKQ